MQHEAAAYELTAEYAGTVEWNGEQVPKFQPGELAIGDSFIDLAEALEAGDGEVVVSTRDQPLIDLLNAYLPLKHARYLEEPAYELQGDRVLRRLAAVRGVHAKTKAREDVIAELEDLDAQEASQRAAIAAGEQPTSAAAAAPGVEPETTSPPATGEPLAGDALKARAAELEIEGRSQMNADELRAAIARVEQELAAGEDEAPDPDAARGGTNA